MGWGGMGWNGVGRDVGRGVVRGGMDLNVGSLLMWDLDVGSLLLWDLDVGSLLRVWMPSRHMAEVASNTFRRAEYNVHDWQSILGMIGSPFEA